MHLLLVYLIMYVASLVLAFWVVYGKWGYQQDTRIKVLVGAGIVKAVSLGILLVLKPEDLGQEMKYANLLADLSLYATFCSIAVLGDTTMFNQHTIDMAQSITGGFFMAFIAMLLVVRTMFTASFLLIPIYSLIGLTIIFFLLFLRKYIKPYQKEISKRASISSLILTIICLLAFYYAE